MVLTNPMEDQEVQFRVGHCFCIAAGGEPRLEVVKKNPKITRFAMVIVQRSTMATT